MRWPLHSSRQRSHRNNHAIRWFSRSHHISLHILCQSHVRHQQAQQQSKRASFEIVLQWFMRTCFLSHIRLLPVGFQPSLFTMRHTSDRIHTGFCVSIRSLGRASRTKLGSALTAIAAHKPLTRHPALRRVSDPSCLTIAVPSSVSRLHPAALRHSGVLALRSSTKSRFMPQ